MLVTKQILLLLNLDKMCDHNVIFIIHLLCYTKAQGLIHTSEVA